jgi:hypothetical protein
MQYNAIGRPSVADCRLHMRSADVTTRRDTKGKEASTAIPRGVGGKTWWVNASTSQAKQP